MEWMWYRTREIAAVLRACAAKSESDAGASRSRVARTALDHSKTLPQTATSTTKDSSTTRSSPTKSETKANFSLARKPASSTSWSTRIETRSVQLCSRTKLPRWSTLKRDVQTLVATHLNLRPASPAQLQSGKLISSSFSQGSQPLQTEKPRTAIIYSSPAAAARSKAIRRHPRPRMLDRWLSCSGTLNLQAVEKFWIVKAHKENCKQSRNSASSHRL